MREKILSSHRGVEQLAARRAHNPKVIGSNPISATICLSDFNGMNRFESYLRQKGPVVKWFNTPPCHGGDRGFDPRLDRHGSVAQSVEQQIEALCVAGSIPAGATIS